MDDVRVFKSLDKKNSFLGIKGLYFRYMCIGLAIDLGVTLLLFPFVGDFVAIIFFLVAAVVLWAVIMKYQGTYSERELKRLMSMRGAPDVIRVEPRSLYDQSKYHQGDDSGTATR